MDSQDAIAQARAVYVSLLEQSVKEIVSKLSSFGSGPGVLYAPGILDA
jgi:hypothetical protein